MMRTGCPGSTNPTARAGRNSSACRTRVLGNDLELEALRIGVLADGGLQRRDPAGGRRADHVGAAALDLGDALLGRRELVAQRLDLLRHECRELLERKARLGELVLLRGELLMQSCSGLASAPRPRPGGGATRQPS